MWTFTLYDDTATVYRQQYTTDAAWYKKSTYAATGTSYNWHLKAQTVERVVDLNMFGKQFLFTTEVGADIQDSDRLQIDNITYEVIGVSEYKGKTFSTTKVLLKKQ